MADSATTVPASAGKIPWWGWFLITAVIVVVVAAIIIVVILFMGSSSSSQSGSISSTSGSGSVSSSRSSFRSSSFASSSAGGPHLPVASTKYNIVAENGTSTQNHVSSSNSFLNVDLTSSGSSSQQQWTFTLVTPISATSGIYTIVNQAGSAIDSTNSATLLAAPTGSSNQQWTVTIQNVTSLWGNSTVVTINQGAQYLTYSLPGNTFSQVTLATTAGNVTQYFSYL